MKLTCAIIDDEPLAVSLIESYVLKTPYLELRGKYNSAINALPELGNHPVDLLFLDIQMPELTGLELSEMLRSDTRIIFTTAFQQYAVDSYKVNALDYLLKPVSYPDFLKAVDKALLWYKLLRPEDDPDEAAEEAPAAKVSTHDSIFVKADYKLVQIELRNILYIEGMKDYIKIYLENDPHPISSLLSIKSMEEILPASRFVRVHRSFIVQFEKIKTIERNRIIFGKEYIPISDSYKQKFMDYLGQRALLP